MNPLSLFTSITIRYDNQWNHCTCIWLFGSFLFPSQIAKSKSKLLLASGSFMGVFPNIASSGWMTQFNHIHFCFIVVFTNLNWMDNYKFGELLGVGSMWGLGHEG